MLRCGTMNVASLNTRLAGALEFMEANRVQVLAIQETRATEDSAISARAAVRRLGNYAVIPPANVDTIGRPSAGVGILASVPITRIGMDDIEESRAVAANVPRPRMRPLVVVCVCVSTRRVRPSVFH